MNPYLERLKLKRGVHASVPEVPEGVHGTSGTASTDARSSRDAGVGSPRDEESGASFCPWGPRITLEMLAEWRCELRMLVAELAAIERWSAEYRAYIFYLVEHQPSLSTVRDDLTWFRDRLNVVRSRTAQDVQQQPPPVIPRSGTGGMP
ncbi:hypothetical protein [Burkholderia sp. Bp9004]|uniref:hypothetical protein n=1 Tax=Burkholderia sp. Bp9004 TaxID=2184559 RepID=UPI000F5DB5A4|nr:hypothetical protein [Burkholderia sp. Bp9004]